MQQKSKRISKKASLGLMSLAALGIMGASGLGASALSSPETRNDSLASRLSARFGLNKDDVSKELQAHRNEQRANRQEEMKVKLSASLQEKVDGGIITAEQKSAIEAKLDENRASREAKFEADKEAGIKPSRSEMKAKREAERNEMDAWLKEQGINLNLKDVITTHKERNHEVKKGGND